MGVYNDYKCSCGMGFDGPGPEMMQHALQCRAWQEAGNRQDFVAGYQIKALSDGTFLVARPDDNINQTHWHVHADGTILSIKESSCYTYNRRQIRQNIRDVTGVDLQLRY